VDDTVPSKNERSIAAIAHLSSIPFPVFGPIVTYILGSRSRFVRFHALHALIGMLLLNTFLFALGAISVILSIVNLCRQYQENFVHFEWWPVILKSAVTWLILLLIGAINLVVNFIQAKKAYDGNRFETGLAAKLANRLTRA
jgi:uncharacterized membrane protein